LEDEETDPLGRLDASRSRRVVNRVALWRDGDVLRLETAVDEGERLGFPVDSGLALGLRRENLAASEGILGSFGEVALEELRASSRASTSG
jgi:hypothetical protein